MEDLVKFSILLSSLESLDYLVFTGQEKISIVLPSLAESLACSRCFTSHYVNQVSQIAGRVFTV